VPFPTAVIASAFRIGTEQDQAAAVVAYAVVGMGSGVAWLLLFSYLRGHRNLIDPKTDLHFFRLTEPILTIVGYGIAALIGWVCQSGHRTCHLPRVPRPVCAPGAERELILALPGSSLWAVTPLAWLARRSLGEAGKEDRTPLAPSGENRIDPVPRYRWSSTSMSTLMSKSSDDARPRGSVRVAPSSTGRRRQGHRSACRIARMPYRSATPHPASAPRRRAVGLGDHRPLVRLQLKGGARLLKAMLPN